MFTVHGRDKISCGYGPYKARTGQMEGFAALWWGWKGGTEEAEWKQVMLTRGTYPWVDWGTGNLQTSLSGAETRVDGELANTGWCAGMQPCGIGGLPGYSVQSPAFAGNHFPKKCTRASSLALLTYHNHTSSYEEKNTPGQGAGGGETRIPLMSGPLQW